jgi:hypothetical protein
VSADTILLFAVANISPDEAARCRHSRRSLGKKPA